METLSDKLHRTSCAPCRTEHKPDAYVLSEKLRLADYNRRHDQRARHCEPVAEKFALRFYDWQLQRPPEESCADCEWDGRDILCEEAFSMFMEEIQGESSGEPAPPSSTAVGEAPAGYEETHDRAKDGEQ